MVKLTKEDYLKLTPEEKTLFIKRDEALQIIIPKMGPITLNRKADDGEIDFYYTDDVGENRRHDRKYNIKKYMGMCNPTIDLLEKSYPNIKIVKFLNKALNYSKDDLNDIISMLEIYKNNNEIIEEHPEEQIDESEDEIEEEVNTEEKVFNYIYLIRKPDLTLHNDPIYKIGKTKQKANFIIRRLRNYGKGTEIYMLMSCKNCTLCEQKVLEEFGKKFKKYKFGNEGSSASFEGNVEEMKSIIYDICKQN